MTYTQTSSQVKTLSDAQWDRISGEVAGAFRLTDAEAAQLRAKGLAKLLAAIPYIAGCVDPHRTALVSVGTYVLSLSAKDAANCRRSDASDVMRRIALLDNYIGGNRAVIRRGLSLVALSMLWDYRQDLSEDVAVGKYNPIAAGDIEFDVERERLESFIREVPCPEMDAIFSLDATPDSYWALA